MRGIELRNVQRKTCEELLVLTTLIQDGAATLDFLLKSETTPRDIDRLFILNHFLFKWITSH